LKIVCAEHCGFCYGVKRAVDLALETREEKAEPVFSLGPLIHNPQVVEQLDSRGIKVVDDVAEISSGAIIIRSHGVGPDVYDAAAAKGIEVIDATCPHVRRAQTAAREFAAAGYTVVVVGERDHPEVRSIVAWCRPQEVYVVRTKDEAVAIPHVPRLGVVAQTTFSSEQFDAIAEVLAHRGDVVKVAKTVCTATELRQAAAASLASKVDAMVVVGGRNSANTSRLAEICRTVNKKVFHIETVKDLNHEWFGGVSKVGITAGASTPDWIIKEVCNALEELEERLAQDTQDTMSYEPGTLLKGKVVGVKKTEVFVDIGGKGEGVVPLAELAYPVPLSADEVVQEGQEIDVIVLKSGSEDGDIILSKVRAERQLAWERLEEARDQKQPVPARIIEPTKGGLVAAVFGLRGFVPASQADLHYVEDLGQFTGQELMVLPIEIDRNKNRVVLSRRAVLEAERQKREAEIYASLAPGQQVTGTVRRLASFGAFIDIGGVEGLAHISDLAWHKVKSPAEVLAVGDTVSAVVLKVDPEAKRISLSLKQAQPDPWLDGVSEFSEGMTVRGRITHLAKFGAFVELKPGIEGLVHVSELADRRVSTPQEVVSPGQEVAVKILGIDKGKKRISLSIAQAREDAERAEYQSYMNRQEDPGASSTIGDRIGHLLKKE